MTTDQAATYPIVLDEVVPAAWHHTEQSANNRIAADHGRRKARLRRCVAASRTAAPGSSSPGTPCANVRRGQYELAVEELANRRLVVAFEELALAI